MDGKRERMRNWWHENASILGSERSWKASICRANNSLVVDLRNVLSLDLHDQQQQSWEGWWIDDPAPSDLSIFGVSPCMISTYPSLESTVQFMNSRRSRCFRLSPIRSLRLILYLTDTTSASAMDNSIDPIITWVFDSPNTNPHEWPIFLERRDWVKRIWNWAAVARFGSIQSSKISSWSGSNKGPLSVQSMLRR